MRSFRPVRFLETVFAALLAGAALGCEREGPAERAGESIDRGVERAGEAVEEAGEEARENANR